MNFQDTALQHFDSLYYFALTISGSTSDAEDLVQETYLRAQKKFDQFGFGTNCKAWMFKIMRNIAIDQQRKTDPLLTNTNEPYVEELYAQPASCERLINSIDLKRAFKALSAKYRIPILLKDVEGFSYQELSEIMNVPQGTVMSRLYRGRKELRTILSGKKSKKNEQKIVVLKK